MQRHEIRPSVTFWLTTVLFGVLTAGVVPLMLILQRSGRPRVADDNGLELHDGTRIPWSSCTHVQSWKRHTDLVFGATTISLHAMQMRAGKQIIADIRQRLGLPPS